MKTKLLTTIIAFAVVCFYAWPQTAVAGAHVGNGGGTSEKYVLQAYYHLGSYIRVCLDSPFCNLSPKERAVLTAIEKSLPDEYKAPRQIQFRSGKKYQSFFTIDGLIRNAVTGNHVGDTIYINTDQLYSAKGRPISLGFAIATLVHELAHHHHVKDSPTDLPDVLGEKVERIYEGDTLTTQTYLSPMRTVLSAEFYSGDKELMISDPTNFLDVSTPFAEQVAKLCGSQKVRKFDLDSLTWSDAVNWDSKKYAFHLPLVAHVDVFCVARNASFVSANIVLLLTARLKKYAPYRFHDYLSLHSIERKPTN